MKANVATLLLLAGLAAAAPPIAQAVEQDSAGAPCVSDPTTFCAGAGSRFKVQTQYTTAAAIAPETGQAESLLTSGAGQAVALTSDTGYFWFFSSNNVEIVIKVVDGTAFNGKFWVFAAGLTNVNVVITVTDTTTGAVKIYTNPQGVAFLPIQDTSAFAGTPEEALRSPGADSETEAASAAIAADLLRLVDPRGARRESSFPEPARAEAAACAPNATRLCLNDGRFEVRVTWTTPDGRSGEGQAVSLTSDTGYFWFFSASNVELVVKVVAGCPLNGRTWVFAGGLTNVKVVMTVTHAASGTVKTYTNPQGTAFAPIQDTDAFDCALLAADLAGTWTGQWVNNTFGSSGPATLVVAVDTAARTFQATLTLGGNVFGVGAPPPQTFSGSYNTSGGTFTQSSPLFGNLSLTISSGGAITGSATNVPNPNIARMDFTGTATPQKITINYTVTFSASAGGGTAQGVLTLNHVS